MNHHPYCPECDKAGEYFCTDLGFPVCTHCGTRMFEGRDSQVALLQDKVRTLHERVANLERLIKLKAKRNETVA